MVITHVEVLTAHEEQRPVTFFYMYPGGKGSTIASLPRSPYEMQCSTTMYKQVNK